MNDTQNDTMLDMLRERERVLAREFTEAKVDAERMVAIADARLSEVREWIDKLTAKKRGRPRKVEAPTTEQSEPLFSKEDPY